MKTYVRLSKYLAKFFLEQEHFHIKFVQETNTHFTGRSFPQNQALYGMMWKTW
jgi:hypothetical protein